MGSWWTGHRDESRLFSCVDSRDADTVASFTGVYNPQSDPKCRGLVYV